MRDKAKLVFAASLLAVLLLVLAAGAWFRCWQADHQQWTATAAAADAGKYVEYAEGIQQHSPLQWQFMRFTTSIEERLQQRRRELEHYRSEAQPLQLARERRQRMRADYDRSAAAMRVSAPVIQAMLAVIDASIAQDRAVPIHIEVGHRITPGSDSDLAAALGSGPAPANFDVLDGCRLELRKTAEPLELERSAAGEYGVFVAYTLKESPYPLVLTETVQGQPQELTLRGLAATVEMKVVRPGGASVRDTRQVSSEGFARGVRVRPEAAVGNAHLYAEMLRSLAANACVATASMLGTRDALPVQTQPGG